MANNDNFEAFRKTHQQFYLVIYTQTDAHVNRYICGGGLDLGLNENGIEEARKFARRFRQNSLMIDCIIGSPELRAIQMADILHDEMKVKLVLWKEFSDQFMGEWEGKPIDPSLDFSNPPAGENDKVFSFRVRAGLERIFKEKDLNLIVTHLRVARKLMKWMGIGNEKIEPGKMYVFDWPVGEGIAHLREV